MDEKEQILVIEKCRCLFFICLGRTSKAWICSLTCCNNLNIKRMSMFKRKLIIGHRHILPYFLYLCGAENMGLNLKYSQDINRTFMALKLKDNTNINFNFGDINRTFMALKQNTLNSSLFRVLISIVPL